MTTHTKPVRTRFAPSPTGHLHIGGARTALLNWLYSRHSGGQFILRIEDTDQNRFVEGAIEQLMDSLRWLGLDWDEGPDKSGAYGPYIQSERLELYQKWANWLVDQGKAYRCYATQEELAEARQQAEQAPGGKIAGYERLHRFLSDEERAKYAAERDRYVIRFAMPLEGQTIVDDRIRGEITFDNTALGDSVLLKSDGFPTYHLAMAVDDHFMEISHVMRTEEWLPSFGLHQNLYDAFGWEAPEWVHMPVILSPSGGKMSKRKPPKDEKGNFIPIMVHEYHEAGYLPDAMVNFLTNIGYTFGDSQEIFTVEETIKRFSLDRINNAAAKFPMSKLDWLNGEYIRNLTDDAFIEAILPYLRRAYGDNIQKEKLTVIAAVVKERVNPLNTVVSLVKFIFDYEPCPAEELIQKKMDAESTKSVLMNVHAALQDIEIFENDILDTTVRAVVEEMGLKIGQVFGTIRQAITAQQISPPLWESMQAIGKDETLARIEKAITILN